MRRRPTRRLVALVTLAGAAVAGGCADSDASAASGASGAAASLPPSRVVVAVVDFSGSQTSHAVREARAYLESVVNGLGYGDRLVLLEMYRTGSRDSVGRFVQDMPVPIRPGAVTSYDERELDAARRGVLNALPIFFDPELVRSIPTTDLFTTLHIAAEHVRDAGDRDRQLLLLTDMLQSTPRFEFAGARRMPPEGWIESQAQEGLLPSLQETCVLVIGADHTTPHGQRVRDFWGEYFSAAGARLEPGGYRLRAPPRAVDC